MNPMRFVFGAEDTQTWRAILVEHSKKRDAQICDLFLRGLEILNLTESEIPDLERVNEILEERSGFRGVYVKGLEDGASFYRMLSERRFPIGRFIRDGKDLGYTPEPDVVHDLYGHLPFFTDKAYGDFCQAFGAEASKYADRPELLRQFERFFWFTVEFGLLETPQGVRVFGAGIASSTGECDYALSGAPRVEPFDVDLIRRQEFRIDIMQPILFRLKSISQLYESLPVLSEKVKQDAERSRQ